MVLRANKMSKSVHLIYTMMFLIITGDHSEQCANITDTNGRSSSINSSLNSNTTAATGISDTKSINHILGDVPLSNYKILFDSLMQGIVKPMPKVPNVTMVPLSWLKNSPIATTSSFEKITTTIPIINAPLTRSPENTLVTPTINDSSTNEALKNESRQEPSPEAKVYNPLMPYPDEYPDEYQTIQNGPALVITRTTYTRIPDVTYTMITTTTLPTYQKMEKAEEAFGQALFGNVPDEDDLRTENVDADTTSSSSSTTTSQYFDINVTKIDEIDRVVVSTTGSTVEQLSNETSRKNNFTQRNTSDDASSKTSQLFDINVIKID